MDNFYPLVLFTDHFIANIYDKFPKSVQNTSSYFINITDYNPSDTDEIIFKNECELKLNLDFNELSSTEKYPIISTKRGLINKLTNILRADILFEKMKKNIIIAFV